MNSARGFAGARPVKGDPQSLGKGTGKDIAQESSQPEACTIWGISSRHLRGAMAEEEEASWDQTLDEWLISEAGRHPSLQDLF
eukprot:s7224_g2.t1